MRHGLSSCGSQALEHRLSSCGARAQLLRSMWDLPGPGLEPMSPALAGGLLTTAPPGKPSLWFFSCPVLVLPSFSNCTTFNVEYLIHIFEMGLKLSLSILVVMQPFRKPEIIPNIKFTEK